MPITPKNKQTNEQTKGSQDKIRQKGGNWPAGNCVRD